MNHLFSVNPDLSYYEAFFILWLWLVKTRKADSLMGRAGFIGCLHATCFMFAIRLQEASGYQCMNRYLFFAWCLILLYHWICVSACRWWELRRLWLFLLMIASALSPDIVVNSIRFWRAGFSPVHAFAFLGHAAFALSFGAGVVLPDSKPDAEKNDDLPVLSASAIADVLDKINYTCLVSVFRWWLWDLSVELSGPILCGELTGAS